MKRITSILTAAAILLGTVSALAEQDYNAKTSIPFLWEENLTEENYSLHAAIPSYEAYYEPEYIQTENEDEEHIHTEVIPKDIQISEEEYNLMGEDVSSPSSAMSLRNIFKAAGASSVESIWKEMFIQQFGDDYLTPYSRKEGSQRISGNTNRLTIEETDLLLAGKNGLNVEIKRKHDNQDYSDAYSTVFRSGDVEQYRNVYSFTNQRTNESIYVAFYTEDDFYTYMYDGAHIKTLSNSAVKTAKKGNTTYSYYDFSYVKDKLTDDSSYDYYEYNSEIDRIGLIVLEKDSTNYLLESRRLLANRNYIGNDWSFVLPEVYLYKYSASTQKYNEGATKEYKEYSGEYYGAFRDLDGNIYPIEGWDIYKKYTSNLYDNTYSCGFQCDDNRHLKLEKYFHAEHLDDGTAYNFTVKDNTGRTYYLFNPQAEETENPQRKQPISIVAVEDDYGNRISYIHSDNYGVISKIIDTYGKEISITHTDNTTVVSYYDDAAEETKNITYELSTLQSSTLDNESPIKQKPVQRLTVTNQIGEQTKYDARETQVVNICRTASISSILGYPIDTHENEAVSRGSNIERIIYPTGAETRYNYKCIYPYITAGNTTRGVYAVSESYDLIGNEVVNKKEYSFSSSKPNSYQTITIKETNDSVQSTTTCQYDKDGLITKQSTYPINGSSPKYIVSYTYASGKPKTIIVDNDGISLTTNYAYMSAYPNLLLSETTDNKKIEYSYHIVDGKYSDKPATITYSKKNESSYIEDYVISTELNDKNSVEYERVTQDSVIKSQTKYGYDKYGNINSIKQWTSETNNDGTLNESDAYTEVVSTYAPSTRTIETASNNILNADNIDEGNVVDTYKLNIYGSPVSYTDSYNIETTIEYDALNRPVKYNLPNGGTKAIVYSSTDSYTIVTDEAGIQYKNVYDALGRIKSKQRLDGASWTTLETYKYDSAGRVTEKVSGQQGAGRIKETYAYDILNRVTTKNVYENTTTLLYTEEYTYNYISGTSWVNKHTIAADGTETADVKTYYDKYGNLVKTEVGAGDAVLTTTSEYDYLGRVTKETDANGNDTIYEYTYDGQISKVTDVLEHSIINQYDLAGRMISSADKKGYTTYTDYDKLGRVIKVTSPFDNTQDAETKTYYDKNSRVVKTAVKKAENSYDIQEYKYDDMGNKVADIVGEGTEKSVVQYEYDTANRLTKLITGLSEYSDTPTGGSTTTYAYNSRGFVETITDPMGQRVDYYDYDIYGNPEWVSDRNGNSFTYNYGAYGVTKQSAWGGVLSTYTYNSLGQVTKTTEKNKNGEIVEETNTYDIFGRLASTTSSDGTVQTYTYDSNSNVLSHSMANNDETQSSTAYEYDSLNRLTKLTNDDIMLQYMYDYNNNLIQIINGTNPNIDLLMSYNKANLLTTYYSRYGGKNYIYRMSYYTDGNKYQERDSVSGTVKNYTYNTVGQLATENETKNDNEVYTASYTYNPYGNRQQMTYISGGTTEVTNYTYDANNRLTNEATSVSNDLKSTISYYYDENGNTTAEQTSMYSTTGSANSNMSMSGHSGGSTMKLYRYDEFNRLIKYNDDGTEAKYTYGVDNLRATKTVNGATTSYVWNGQNLASETKNNTTTIYAYDPTGVISSKTGNEVTRFIKDPHGNVIATSKNNTIFGTYDYTAFGNQIENTDTTTPFRYCGEYYDEESGLTYLRNRYYNSATGRFITEDPIRDGANWYVYCGGNPILLLDPTGLYYVWIRDAYSKASFSFTTIESGKLKVNVKQSESEDLTYVDGVDGTKIYDGKMYIWIQPNTGSATPHKDSKGSLDYEMSQNCYTYATGLESHSSRNPGYISGMSINIRDVYSVADAVVADLNSRGISGRIIGEGQEGISADITSEEYRIALRVGPSKDYLLLMNDGKVEYVNKPDYHFMVENSDGTWSEKHGIIGNAIHHKLYDTPQSLTWNLGSIDYYYDSDIVYIAVGKQGN